MKEQWLDPENNVVITAKSITLGEDISFGKNVSIEINGDFSIGARSQLGDNCNIKGNNVTIGKDFYNSGELRIGGGGYNNPMSDFVIGDRCTTHNNFINIAMPVIIGDDVGLSVDVSIITHGYWLSVLDGFPAKFLGVTINNGVIIGYRTIILMGAIIAEKIVVGAGSVVTKPLEVLNSVYAGNPAKFIKTIKPIENKEVALRQILENYKNVAKFHKLFPIITINYPFVTIGDTAFNVETLEFAGPENIETDDFRDYIRKFGLRFYSDRPFKSNQP